MLVAALMAAPLSSVHRVVATGVTIALTVVTLTWGVMPILTKLLSRWLHKH